MSQKLIMMSQKLIILLKLQNGYTIKSVQSIQKIKIINVFNILPHFLCIMNKLEKIWIEYQILNHLSTILIEKY